MKIIISITCVLIFALQNCKAQKQDAGTFAGTTQNEVIYHVFQRSFYDSNNDQIGDVNGLRLKLDYLQDLGVTSILMLPLFQSDYYHNYFASDFTKIDPEYGTMQDYLQLVKDIHKRGMKLYLDMETQYVTEDHPWFKNSYKNPASPYSDYILYKDSANTQPESIFGNLSVLPGYNGIIQKAATVNLYNKEVKKFNYDLFRSWVDPNGDGKFDDGADGFRLDHMMDNLDYKGRLPHLFAEFWKPLIDNLKKINPDLKFMAEQAGGVFGFEYFNQADVDRLIAFQLQQAIVSFNKNNIAAMADTIFSNTPPGKQQVVLLENHDLQRFSSAVNQNRGKMKIGAALNLFIGGVPSIYYGQELGMTGTNAMGKYGLNDGNDIPMREAFEWYQADTGKGMALWYKNSGPWWDNTNLKPNDGISLEEEKNDPNSLWNFYKKMLHLRKTTPALINGSYQTLENNNSQVYSFIRKAKERSAVVVINLSDAGQKVSVNLPAINRKFKLQNLYGGKKATVSAANQFQLDLPAYSIQLWEIK